VRSFIVALCLAGCAPQLQTLEIVNQTPRVIEAVYVFAPGADRGASRGKLAPNERTSVQVKPGAVEVDGVSEKYQLDEHTRDKPEASQTLEIHGSAKVIFYDQGAAPPEVKRPGVFGAEFTIPAPRPGAEP
jgi:hypothetical protein